MNKKQLKISLTNRLNAFNKIIERLEKELKEATSTAKIKEIEKDLQFQKGFRHGLFIALSDMNYKITKKNKYILNY
jgi:uncharacterized protein (UPF0335 family)